MTSMDNTPDSPAKTPEGYTTQGGNFWTLITPEIWKVLHAVLQTPALSSGGTSLLQARTVNEVVKAQTNKVRLARLKGELVDRSQAVAHVFKLARAERDAWLNWPARRTIARGS